jgi:alkyl sulfatase BDS1-like metallo-beta-lactamase superfamily hydrolase
MSDRGEPLYKHRPVAPSGARFGRCERINEFICLSEGNSNSYLIETDEGNVLVNTGMGFEAPVHLANYQSMTDIDKTGLAAVVVTQGHVDHVGGVQFFRDRFPGLRFIATAANEEHQDYDTRLAPFRSARSAFRFTDDFIELFQYYAEQGYTDFPQQDRPTADESFESRHRLELGGLELELIAQPGAETNDSLVIWLPQHRICLTGNLFGCPFGHFPNLVTIRGDRYRDALTCAEAVKTVMDLEPEMILYGHHGPVMDADLIARELTALHGAILHVHDATVAGMNEGKSVETLQQEIGLPPELEVGEGYGKVSWGVRAIWEHYAGWFHHQSTTELYSVPRSEVSADLVALAGSEALLSRARQRYEAGDAEAALHLLDILRQAEPENREAVELSLAVHDYLLERAREFRTTGNFWLEGWLENQIKLLRGGSEQSLATLIK